MDIEKVNKRLNKAKTLIEKVMVDFDKGQNICNGCGGGSPRDPGAWAIYQILQAIPDRIDKVISRIETDPPDENVY